jgi:Tfp pilus assembly protein PilF
VAVLAASCRFRDCRHDLEPGCAVKAAVASGELDADRFEGYSKIAREQDDRALELKRLTDLQMAFRIGDATYVLRTVELLDVGENQKAIAELETALKLDPKSVAGHTMLGSLHEINKDPTRAQSQYREALKLDPQTAVAANNLAWILAESGGNLDEALALARIAKDKLPNSPTVLDTMGWVYYKKGAYASASDLFTNAVAKDPKSPVYHYHLGLSYFQGAHFVRWPLLMAANVMSLLPMLLVFIGAQRYFVQSVANTGLKG